MPIVTYVYALVVDPLSEVQGRLINDMVLGAGGRLAVAVPPDLLVFEGGDDVASALSTLMGDGVRAVGDDDVTPLLAAAAGGPPELLTELAGLVATTSAASAAAEASRPHADEDWVGFSDFVGGE